MKRFLPSKTRLLRRAARSRRERGMALLFTLCILALALVTAMIFSENAMTDRKVAASFVDSTSARILADGTVSRAIVSLMNSEAPYVCSNYLLTRPSIKPVYDEFAADWIWKLEKKDLFSFNNGPLRFSSTYYDLKDTRCPSWEYVFYKDNDKTDHIYGRYAYVAIGHNDQLNPNAIGNHSTHGTGGSCDKSCERRLGRWTSEPKFIFKSTKNGWDYTKELTPDRLQTLFQANQGKHNAAWTELDMFMTDLKGSGSITNEKHLKMMLDQYFDLSSESDYNKFNSSGAIMDATVPPASGEAYRFALIRNDWDSISVDSVAAGIPWFANSSVPQRNQTIANLINFNASINRAPVTDNDNWAAGEPSYTGNKRTPYINEAGGGIELGGALGSVQSSPIFVDGQPPRYTVWYSNCTYTHFINFKVETVNMYPRSGSYAALAVRPPVLYGKVSYEYFNPEGNNWVSKEINIDGNSGLEIEAEESGPYTVYNYSMEETTGGITTTKKGPFDTNVGHQSSFYPELKIRNVKVTLNRVVLSDSRGMNADLALMPTQISSGAMLVTGEKVVAGSGDTASRSFFDAQVNDPRFNLGRDQWTYLASVNEGNWDSNMGSENRVINRGSQYDPEDRTDPGYNSDNSRISTAFIRHESMHSLWELGAVHRGAPWQTINLKCAGKTASGMGEYQLGDGHILDQTALTDNANERILGMINLNCVADFGENSAPFAFKSLFIDFPLTNNGNYAALDNYPGQASGITVIEGNSIDSSDSEADKYAKQLADAVTNAVSQANPARRTAIFPETAGDARLNKIIPDSGNDAQREEIVGRIMNLLKWSRQKTKRATVLVLAQTIKDVGGDIVLEKDPSLLTQMNGGFVNYNGRSLASALTSYTTNLSQNYKSRRVQFSAYDNLYDQITGEAKIIVRLEWDSSANNNKGAWKITRKEYVE